MHNRHNVRPSDSPFIQAVTYSASAGAGQDIITPDGLWDLIIARRNGQASVFLMTSPLMKATSVSYEAGDESLVISFKPGAFITAGSGKLDTKGMYALPMMGTHAFMLGSSLVELPTFENAEAFAEVLAKRQLLARDAVVQSIATGEGRAQSERTVQRHFRHITGMTPNYYQQIQRALQAAELLRQGESALVVAHDLGYYDQSHLSRSLKAILGQSPSEI
jgi:AraC-like DNA-binding protein